MTSTPRQPKQTREELKALLLATGMDILCEQGLGTGAEALTFKRVFDRIEQQTGTRLTNASAIIRRVWENQADYQADVLAAVASDSADFEWDRTFAAVTEVLESVDLSTPEARWQGLVELCRVAGAANVAALRESPIWPTWIGVWALAASGEAHEYRPRIESALVEAYSTHALRFEEAYAGLAAYFGLGLQEPLTVRQFAIAAESLAEGSALRHHVSAPDMEGILRPTGPGGGAPALDPVRGRSGGPGQAVLLARPRLRPSRRDRLSGAELRRGPCGRGRIRDRTGPAPGGCWSGRHRHRCNPPRKSRWRRPSTHPGRGRSRRRSGRWAGTKGRR